jgi:hypothetical protein
MDKSIEILLGSYKNINSVNTDSYDKLELTNNTSELMEYNINDVVNSTDVFDAEREANAVYRIYGKIEYLSMLNGLKNNVNNAAQNYGVLEDFFLPTYDSTAKNILNSFDFYLVRPAVSGYTEINETRYIRYFQVIAKPSDFEIFPAGFSNNVYGEQAYAFSFKKDFDVSQYYDNFGFPITELFLFPQYIRKTNRSSVSETMSATTWSNIGVPSKMIYPPTGLNIGDYVKTTTGAKLGELIEYNKEEFTQRVISGQTVYISTYYQDGYSPKSLIWKFNPFIPFRLRYFGDQLNSANTGSTSYDVVNSIPEYATKLDNNGNYVWRDILPQGYVEPLTGIGVDYPFLNKRRYLFSSIVFSVVPDLTNSNTLNVFKQIWYSRYATNQKITPLTDLTDIGKPCQ